MKIVEQKFELLGDINPVSVLKNVEKAGRVCYKSEHLITEDSYKKFIAMLVKREHLAVLEHGVVSVIITTNRGVTHELVRHRLASYCQESSRYCNYSQDKFGKEITVIKPEWHKRATAEEIMEWEQDIKYIEKAYFRALERGQQPDQARGLLPNDLKTEIVVTMNLRSWIHFFDLRTSSFAHEDIRFIAREMHEQFKVWFPEVFRGEC